MTKSSGWLLRVGGLALGFLLIALGASANSFSLGDAGTFTVMGLAGTDINNSLVTISGNEGVSASGKLVNMAPSQINGNVYEFTSGQYSGPGDLDGVILQMDAFMNAADTAALNESSAAAKLAATQTISGNVNSALTITGKSGLNVIDINGNVNNSITLTGPADAVFIINVKGSVNLTGSEAFKLTGGVTESNVLYNFTAGSGSISTHVGNIIFGTILAPDYNLTLDGTFNGDIIAGGNGNSITLMSGVVINGLPVTPTPEPASLLLLGTGLLGLGIVVRRRAAQHISYLMK